MQVYVAELLHDFMESNKDLVAPGAGQPAQFVSVVSKRMTKGTLYGARPIESWRHCRESKEYFLFTMPLGEALAEAKAKALDAVREEGGETFKGNQEKALQALSAEWEKRRRRESGEP
jgi:hypothetical protein